MQALLGRTKDDGKIDSHRGQKGKETPVKNGKSDLKVNMRLTAEDPFSERKPQHFGRQVPLDPGFLNPNLSNQSFMDYYDQDLSN